MKISELNHRLSSIFGEKIRLYELTNQDAKKYEKRYILREDEMFKENFIYGVKIDSLIYFDFKVKSFDNVMKSFYTNFINKYLAHTFCIIDNNFVELGVIRAKEKLSISLDNERICKFLTYSTNYGIGIWCFFIPKTTFNEAKKQLETLLSKNKIGYKNEFSDAGWVYRYLISGSYIDHNLLIEQL